MKSSTSQFNAIAFVVSAAVAFAFSVEAAPPRLLPFQGRLTDANGAPVSDGAKVVQFRIYDAPTGGTAVWNGEVQKVTVNGGLVSTLLGSKAELTAVDFNEALYLEITVDANADNQITTADPPLLPRQSILPAVFAVEAQSARDSQKLGGYDWSALFDNGNPATGKISGTKLANDSVTAAQLAANAVTADKIPDGAIQDRHIGILSRLAASDGNPANALNVDAEGRVGIGKTNPQAALDVVGALQIDRMAQQSLALNGYVKIGELIIQWGQETVPMHDITSRQQVRLNYAIPFPNEVLVVIPGIFTGTSELNFASTIGVTPETGTQYVTLLWDKWIPGNVAVRAQYIAIGR